MQKNNQYYLVLSIWYIWQKPQGSNDYHRTVMIKLQNVRAVQTVRSLQTELIRLSNKTTQEYPLEKFQPFRRSIVPQMTFFLVNSDGNLIFAAILDFKTE